MNAVKTKKGLAAFLAVLTAAALMLSLVANAFASGTTAGAASSYKTYLEEKDGSATIHITKLLDENADHGTTTGLQRTDLGAVKPLAGAKFKIKKIYDYDPATGQFTKVDNGAETESTATSSDGTTSFTGLELGIYEFWESSAPENVTSTDGKTVTSYSPDPTHYNVSIPLFNSAGQLVLKDNNPVTDIYLYPKNPEQQVTKKESAEESGAYDVYAQDSPLKMDLSTIYWYKVDLVVPVDYSTDKYTSFEFQDQLDSKISYGGTAKMILTKKTGGETDITSNAGVQMASAGAMTTNKAGELVSAKVTVASLDNGVTLAPGDTLTLKFSAVLNKENIEAAANKFAAVPNEAKVLFVGNDSKTVTTPKTYTKPEPGKLQLKKVSSKDNSVLDGAQFDLYRVLTEDQAAKLGYTRADIPKTDAGQGAKEQGVKIGDTKTTAGGGLIEWTDLAPGEYRIVETKAPSGYNELPEALKVTVVEGNVTATANIITVSNTPTGNLPRTGGIGTPLFIVGGTLMMGCAAYFLFRNRREQH